MILLRDTRGRVYWGGSGKVKRGIDGKYRRTKDEALMLLKEKIRQVAELLKKAQRIMEE